eukprot:symbB.v1.2.013491.t1/scaffold957.1/size148979/9
MSLPKGRCGAVVVGRTDLTGNDAGSLWHCGGEAACSSVLLDQCSVSGSSSPSSSHVASPAVVAAAYAMLVLWDCFAPAIRKGTLAAVIRAEVNSKAVVAGDGPTLGWPGWSSKGKSRPDYVGGASIGSGRVAWMDVSGRFVLGAPEKKQHTHTQHQGWLILKMVPLMSLESSWILAVSVTDRPRGGSSGRSVVRAQRPSSASQSLQNWPAVNWNASRGRTASTISQMSSASELTEKKPPIQKEVDQSQELGDGNTTTEVAESAEQMPSAEEEV